MSPKPVLLQRAEQFQAANLDMVPVGRYAADPADNVSASSSPQLHLFFECIIDYLIGPSFSPKVRSACHGTKNTCLPDFFIYRDGTGGVTVAIR